MELYCDLPWVYTSIANIGCWADDDGGGTVARMSNLGTISTMVVKSRSSMPILLRDTVPHDC